MKSALYVIATLLVCANGWTVLQLAHGRHLSDETHALLAILFALEAGYLFHLAGRR